MSLPLTVPPALLQTPPQCTSQTAVSPKTSPIGSTSSSSSRDIDPETSSTNQLDPGPQGPPPTFGAIPSGEPLPFLPGVRRVAVTRNKPPKRTIPRNQIYSGEAPWAPSPVGDPFQPVELGSSASGGPALEYLPLPTSSWVGGEAPPWVEERSTSEVKRALREVVKISVFLLSGRSTSKPTCLDHHILSSLPELLISGNSDEEKTQAVRVAFHLHMHFNKRTGMKAFKEHIESHWQEATRFKGVKTADDLQTILDLVRRIKRWRAWQVAYFEQLSKASNSILRDLFYEMEAEKELKIKSILQRERIQAMSLLTTNSTVLAKEFPLATSIVQDGGLTRGAGFFHLDHWFDETLRASLPPVNGYSSPISICDHLLRVKNWQESDFRSIFQKSSCLAGRSHQDLGSPPLDAKSLFTSLFSAQTITMERRHSNAKLWRMEQDSAMKTETDERPTSYTVEQRIQSAILQLFPPHYYPHLLCGGYHSNIMDVIRCVKSHTSQEPKAESTKPVPPYIANKIKNGLFNLLLQCSHVIDANTKFMIQRDKLWQSSMTSSCSEANFRTSPSSDLSAIDDSLLVSLLESALLLPLSKPGWSSLAQTLLHQLRLRPGESPPNVPCHSFLCQSRQLGHLEFLELLNCRQSRELHMNGLSTFLDLREQSELQRKRDYDTSWLALREYLVTVIHKLYKRVSELPPPKSSTGNVIYYQICTKSGANITSTSDWLTLVHGDAVLPDKGSERRECLDDITYRRHQCLKLLNYEIAKTKVTLGTSRGKGGGYIRTGMVIQSLNAEETSGEPHRYLALKCLGRGGFAEVWEVCGLDDQLKHYAAKFTFLDGSMSARDRETILEITCREVNVQSLLRPYSDNFVSMLECFEIAPHIFCTIMELGMPYDLHHIVTLDRCCGGEDVIDRARYLNLLVDMKECLKLSRDKLCVKSWIKAIIQCLVQLEKLAVVHRDIKPANLLLIRDGPGPPTVKLADFGLARYVQLGQNGCYAASIDYGSYQERALGTLLYQSPEACHARIRRSHYLLTYAEDMWQAGVVVYNLIFEGNAVPFGNASDWGHITPSSHHLSHDDGPASAEESSDFIAACIISDTTRHGYWSQTWNSQSLDLPWRTAELAVSGLTKLEEEYLRDLVASMLAPIGHRITPRDAIEHPFLC